MLSIKRKPPAGEDEKRKEKKSCFNGVVYITYIRTLLAVEFGNTFIGSSGVATELNSIKNQLAMRVIPGEVQAVYVAHLPAKPE